jgi:cell wall-associated NlpC family hydrolase
MTGQDIAEAAARYVGVPFRHLGRSREGLDCIGLAICVCWDLRLLTRDQDVRNYSRTPNGRRLSGELRAHGLIRTGQAPAPGMLVTMRYGREPMHLGIVGVGGDTLIHADARAQGVTQVHIGRQWRARMTSVWRFPAVHY